MRKVKKLKSLSIILAVIMLFNTFSMDALAVSEWGGVDDQYLEIHAEEDTDAADETDQVGAAEDADPDAAEEQETDAPAAEEQAGEPETVADDETEAAEETEEPAVEAEAVESEAEVSAEESNEDDVFPGLGAEYQFSAKQFNEKRELAKYRGNGKKYDPDAEYPDKSGYVLGEVVCRVKTKEEAVEIAEAFGGTLKEYAYEIATISLSEGVTVARAVAAASDPDMDLPAVWPNDHVYATADYGFVQGGSDDVVEIKTAKNMPNDPALKSSFENEEHPIYQWQHTYIGDPYVWALGYKGEDVRVAVIDTGLQVNHEDLSANAEVGLDFVEHDTPVNYSGDHQQHGSHVAGIIAAQENNGKGGAGIAPDATIKGYAVLGSDGRGSSDNIMRAIAAAIVDGVDLINMSLGGGYYSAPYQELITTAYEAGIAVFASAGNEATNGWAYPASYEHVISVGALNPDGTRASFSNFGSTVDLSFPGVNIYSTVPDGYGYKSGTSQACPAAVGTAAVILSADPALKAMSGGAKVDALLAKMQSAVKKSGSPNMGAGTTYLPQLFRVAPDDVIPATPAIELTKKSKSAYDAALKAYRIDEVEVTLSTATPVAGIQIYYSVDGKKITYKNGVLSSNANLYSGGTIGLDGQKKVTINAIALNPMSGAVSKAATATYTLMPTPDSVEITSTAGNQRIAAGKSITLKAEVLPAYAISTKVEWSVDDATKKKGITVSTSGVVKAATSTPAGSYTVRATAVGNDGKKYNGEYDEFIFKVISSDYITKVAFLGSDNKAVSKYTMKASDEWDLGQYLKVTKKDGTTTTDSGEVMWTSSNPKVASVNSNGLVVANMAGTAAIKAVSNDGTNKSASCTFTVTQPVTSIVISGPKKAAVGKSIKLTVDVSPGNATNKKLKWDVESGTNVTVNNGTVSVKSGASGEVIVRATAQDGSKVSETYSISILADPITSITLPNSQKSITLFSTPGYSNAQKTYTLTPTVKTAKGGSSAYEFTTNAPEVATVSSSGEIEAVSPGKATITCASTDGSNKKATCTVNVNVPMSSLSITAPSSNWTDEDNNSNTCLVAIGKSISLKATYGCEFGTPTNTKLIWKSADPSIAKVDNNGKVTAIKDKYLSNLGDGTTITASAADGSGISCSFDIIVSPSYDKLVVDHIEDTRYMYVYGLFKYGKWTYTVDYLLPDCKVEVSGIEGVTMEIDYENDIFYPVVPNTMKPTTTKTYADYEAEKVRLTKRDFKKVTMKLTLMDGSNKSVTCSQYICVFPDADGWVCDY